MGAHFDRILCPKCLRRFRDMNAVKTHMRVKKHDQFIGDFEAKRQAKALRRYNNAKQGDSNA